VVIEVSGSDTAAPYDTSVTNSSHVLTGTASNPFTTGATGSFAQANNFVIAAAEFFAPNAGGNPGGISDPPSGWTSLYAQQAVQSTVGAQMSYKVVSATTGQTATWGNTNSGITSAAGLIVAFKEGTADTLMAQAWM
jgi:hypothetical protein